MEERIRKAIVDVLAVDRKFHSVMTRDEYADAIQELLEANGELSEAYYAESPQVELIEN